MKEKITVWTDGACFPNPGRGGWGWTTLKGEQGYGGLLKTTNQVMELTAVREALTALYQPERRIIVITDSMYTINSLTLWCKTWVMNGWRNSAGKPVKNRELIQGLLQFLQGKDIIFQWVKGHAGDPGNEEADRLATLGSGASPALIAKCSRNWHGAQA